MTQNRIKYRINQLFKQDWISLFVPLLLIFFLTALLRPDFVSYRNISSMFQQIPFVAITALGCGLVLMVGKVDISTGSVAGLAGIIMSVLVVDFGWTGFPAISIALLCCVVVGIINATLVLKFEMHSFIATMSTLFIIGGARYLFIKGYQLSLGNRAHFPLGTVFRNTSLLGMSVPFWIMVLFFIVASVAINRTLWGRHLLAIGDNWDVALLAGINTKRITVAAYLLSSVLSGIAGILLTLDIGLGLPETGDGWAFRAVAGCVIGGASIGGGRGTALGILIGVTLIFSTENAIIFLGVPATMRVAVQGALMALAVAYDQYKKQKKTSTTTQAVPV